MLPGLLSPLQHCRHDEGKQQEQDEGHGNQVG